MKKLLIFDMDDTLFETRSIPQSAIQGVLDLVRPLINQQYSGETVEQILFDLWRHPFDQVAKTYAFGSDIHSGFVQAMQQADFNLDIQTFDDYPIVQALPHTKMLVTTGFLKLQQAKIQALALAPDFEEIHIDDILAPDRMYKKGIFTDILRRHPFEKSSVYVIGDNPRSELTAAKELQLVSIQIAKFGQERSKQADHFIESFKELEAIIG